MTKPDPEKKAKRKARSVSGRRERIIVAAFEAFAENGIAPTTLRDVAKRAGVDPPLIHYYFADLEALHLAVISHVLEDLKEYSLRGAERWPDRPEKWIEEYIQAPLNWIRDRPDSIFLWIYFYTLACRPGAFRDLNQEIRKTGRDRIALKVFEGVEKGVFKLETGVTAADVALEIQSWMTGSAIIYATESHVDFKLTAKTLRRRVLAILGLS